jgi:ATP-dependent Clp protease adaptor protein ClpS
MAWPSDALFPAARFPIWFAAKAAMAVWADDERLQAMSDGDKRKDDGRKDDGRTDGGGDSPATGVVVKARPKTRKPAMYKVLMLNDDYTPMEFVVHVLERFFQKSREEATRIMLHVHRRGVGVCGVFTYEVAETKVTQVMDLARQNQHPLQCTIEKE